MRVADPHPSDRNPRVISTSHFENVKRSLEHDRKNPIVGGRMALVVYLVATRHPRSVGQALRALTPAPMLSAKLAQIGASKAKRTR